MTRRPDVLVVGAGPTGLALALQAHDHGARVCVVERRPAAFRPSRALIVHPRTLEVLRPLGVVDALLARADVAPSVHLHLGSRVVPVRLTDLALPDTAFPHLTLLRQADVEAVLAAALAERGVDVRRGTELIELRDGADEVHATLRSTGGVEERRCVYLAGCDGAGSTVRARSGIGWQGGRYQQEVVLADVQLASELTPGVAHVVAGRDGLLFVFAIGERAPWRLLATRSARSVAPPDGQPVPADELQRLLGAAGLAARITRVAWSARIGLQHRMAARHRSGRLFLAGDAAHCHSPAGGQGMNTGIQDAVNLGWKLAFAATSSDPSALLDSYERERRPVARQVLALTHLVFWAEASTDPFARVLRGALAPLAAPALPLILDRRRLVAEGVRVLAQLRVHYRRSPLSVEGPTDGPPFPPGMPRAGERMPDGDVSLVGRDTTVHQLLARPGVHILLNRDARRVEAVIRGPQVHLHRLISTPGSDLLAVRPDGYVGFRGGSPAEGQLGDWLARIGARA